MGVTARVGAGKGKEIINKVSVAVTASPIATHARTSRQGGVCRTRKKGEITFGSKLGRDVRSAAPSSSSNHVRYDDRCFRQL